MLASTLKLASRATMASDCTIYVYIGDVLPMVMMSQAECLFSPTLLGAPLY